MADMIYNVSSPAPEPYEFETYIDKYEKMKWVKENWHYSIYYSIVYLTSIFSLHRYMKNRPPFNLRYPLITWNMGLALFSIVATCRMLPGFIHILKEFGFTFSLCDAVYGYRLQASFFWGWFFVLSKVVEFGDTFFIILRKRKLIFLHWYHHVATVLMVYYIGSYRIPISHWCSMMNFTVHSFMYTYYALRSMDIKVPQLVAMGITALQISQMFMGTFLVLWVLWIQRRGGNCYFPDDVMKVCSSVYFSYLVLFCNYFYQAYISPCSSKNKKKME